jgi:serine/threonine-protein kinase
MGSVYLAVNRNINQRVAIKVLNDDRAGSESVRRRFRDEAQLLCSLDHPNIVRFLNFVENEDGIFLIMEYADGITLEDFISRENGLIVEKRAYDIFAQILDAFACAHRRGVVHRDIKPANIILTRDRDGRFVVKVLDFGIARILSESADDEKGWVIGTPAYMSPEQITGGTADARSDIYSLGVLLHQMLTGKAPYDATTLSEPAIRDKVTGEPLLRMKEYYPYISDRAQKIVDRATAKDAGARFHSCSDFRRAWKDALNPDPVPPTVKYIAAAVILLLLGGGGWLWDWNRTKVDYYKDYAERWGAPEGIHRLSHSAFRHREASYRFERRRGKALRVSYVNSRGKIVKHHDSEHTERADDMLLFYSDDGKVDYVKHLDANGKVLYKKDYDENLKTVIFRHDDENGTEMNLAASTTKLFANAFDNTSDEKSRVSRYLLAYDEKGYLAQLKYAGFQNVPVCDSEGLYGRAYAVDEKGRVVEAHYLGYDGAPKANKAGLAIKKFEYGANDDWIKVTYSAANGELSSDGNGCPVVMLDYDRYGNRIRETYYDGEGNLSLRKDTRTAGFSYAISDEGFVVRQTTFGLDGEVCYVPSEGYASTAREYDANGYMSKTTFLDPEENPVTLPGGYASVAMENDAKGNVLTVQYFDADGNACETVDGYARTVTGYDAAGNSISTFVYGINDSLCLFNGDVAGFRTEYNDKNKVSKQTCYGTDSLPTEDVNGVTVWKCDYGTGGELVRVSYCAADGQTLKANHRGVAGWKSEYENGNETKREFFDETESPVAGTSGYARMTSAYDANGNLRQVRYYDAQGEPVTTGDGAGYDCEYDERGNMTQYVSVGKDGTPAPGRLAAKYGYDRNDNQTSFAVYARDGDRATNSDGYHRKNSLYDGKNQLQEERYYDSRDEPCVVKSTGYATVTYRYDSRGNETGTAYFDASGSPCAGQEGYASRRNEYDATGRLTRQTYFDERGAPTRPSVFVPEGLAGYDRRGNMNRIASADGYGRLIDNPRTGWAVQRREFDARGNIVGEVFLDRDSLPALDRDIGAHRTEYVYSRQGKRTEARYFGLDGALRESPYAIARTAYDGRGRELEFAYFDPHDRAVDVKGWHRYILSYGAQGEPSDVRYYTANGRLHGAMTYDRNTGEWQPAAAAATATDPDAGDEWRQYWKRLMPECPVLDSEGGIRIEISSIALTARGCNITLRFVDVSKYDLPDETLQTYKEIATQLAAGQKRESKMPSGTRLTVIGLDRAKRELFRITN